MSGSTFIMASSPTSGDEALVWPMVDAGLRAKGMAPATQAPRYLVNIGYTDRPGVVGAYAQTKVTEKGAAPDWLAPPERRRLWGSSRRRLCMVSIVFNDAASGQEIYRVRAMEPTRAASCRDSAARLVQTALTEASVQAD